MPVDITWPVDPVCLPAQACVTVSYSDGRDVGIAGQPATLFAADIAISVQNGDQQQIFPGVPSGKSVTHCFTLAAGSHTLEVKHTPFGGSEQTDTHAVTVYSAADCPK